MYFSPENISSCEQLLFAVKVLNIPLKKTSRRYVIVSIISYTSFFYCIFGFEKCDEILCTLY